MESIGQSPINLSKMQFPFFQKYVPRKWVINRVVNVAESMSDLPEECLCLEKQQNVYLWWETSLEIIMNAVFISYSIREITFQYFSLLILLFNYSPVSKYPLNNIACKASQKAALGSKELWRIYKLFFLLSLELLPVEAKSINLQLNTRNDKLILSVLSRSNPMTSGIGYMTDSEPQQLILFQFQWKPF